MRKERQPDIDSEETAWTRLDRLEKRIGRSEEELEEMTSRLGGCEEALRALRVQFASYVLSWESDRRALLRELLQQLESQLATGSKASSAGNDRRL